jgi:cation-transporting ATPase E
LTAAEVADRTRRGLSNDFQARVGRTYRQILRDNILNLFNIVLGALLVIVIIYHDYVTVFFAGFSVFTNSVLGILQEISAKRKLDRLAALSEQKVKVRRDGQLTEVPMKKIVVDDVISIEPGDRLVVDGRILHADSLEIDESHLTGESDAVIKEANNEVFSGSFCIAGTGVMVATRVGKDSTVNKLSTIAKTYRNVRTPTQQKISAMVELSVVIMFIFVPMLFISGYLRQTDFLPVIKNAVVFVTSLVPQGLVLVATLSLTIGAIRISRHQTLIQRVNAVESLANVTVLCFDKTGTLTRNQLAVKELLPLNDATESDVCQRLRLYTGNLAYLNSTARAIEAYSNPPDSDSLDSGLKPTASPAITKIREVPFTSSRKWGAIVFPDETLILGAPERVLPHDGTSDRIRQRAQQLASEGLRVLAFARTAEQPQDGHLSDAREPLALIVLSDQVREDIQDTLLAFSEQNIALKVISGDNVETVQAIAKQAGMSLLGAYTGDLLDKMGDAELDVAVKQANLFARIEPDTKRRIIAALKRQGEYVAMVGDGVNDVPALKEAHMAVVMNEGTQISKDVADIVLLNNAMSTLPLAFKEGREITQTVYGTTKMFLIKNMYNVLLFIFAGFMFTPFPITPVQISWSAFGTVNMPATFIAFGWWRPQFMKHFRRDVLDYIIIGGLIGAVVLSILYAIIFLAGGRNVEEARSAVTLFVCLYGMLIVWNTHGVDIFDARSFRRRWGIVLVSGVMTILTILVPYILPGLFEFVPPLWPHDAPVIILIAALFDLSLILFSVGMRNRYLINRLWMLFAT